MRFMERLAGRWKVCVFLVLSTLVSISLYFLFGYLDIFFSKLYKHPSPPIVWGASPSIGLLVQFRDVVIKPVPVQLVGHVLGPGDPASADPVPCPAGTLECLVHVPLGAGVEEGEGIACLQRTVVHNTHLHAAHVENQRWRA